MTTKTCSQQADLPHTYCAVYDSSMGQQEYELEPDAVARDQSHLFTVLFCHTPGNKTLCWSDITERFMHHRYYNCKKWTNKNMQCINSQGDIFLIKGTKGSLHLIFIC